MKYIDLIKKIKKEYQIDEKTINYMFKYYLKLDPFYNNENIDNKIIEKLLKKIQELKRGLPIQYVVGNVDFYGYNFVVDKRVLIPRFETEELVYYTKKYIDKYFKDNLSILDVGTGSGVIGITLKKEIPSSNVTLIDISNDALSVSSINADNLNVKVNIYKSDMLTEVIKRKEKYDVLISNPPYISEEENIMDIVKENEPSIALYGGKGGLKYYRMLLSGAKDILKEKALIAFEIGAKQSEDIVQLANEYFKGFRYEIKKDLEGRDRMFFIFYNLND